MKPNWFIAFTIETTGLTLPLAPDGLRVFAPADRHLTIAFLGRLHVDAVFSSWAQATRLSWREVEGGFSEVRQLGGSALSAIISTTVPDLADMLKQRESLCKAAGVFPGERSMLPHITLARMPHKPLLAVRDRMLQWAGAVKLDSARFHTTGVGLFTWADEGSLRLFKVVEHLAF